MLNEILNKNIVTRKFLIDVFTNFFNFSAKIYQYILYWVLNLVKKVLII